MDRYYGFDLGDAESAVTFLKKNDAAEPQVVPVREAGSFITAYARLRTGELLIGEAACYAPDAVERQLRFKSRFLTDPTVSRDLKSFAGGVLGELYMSGGLVKGEDCSFYVGCPAGWDKGQRERYREIFEAAGYPPVRIVSESRAALISACQSKHFQVGYDILSRPVLVVDMGSSTTDFAHVSSGREVELQTAGEVRLGGGIMDELLLEAAVDAAPERDLFRRIFRESEPWHSYCEFAARRLKEKYFADEDYWKDRDCLQTVTIPAGEILAEARKEEETEAASGGFVASLFGRRRSPQNKPGILRLQLRINAQIAEQMLEGPAQQLGGKSFHQVLGDSLAQIREKLEAQESLPELLFLTGGVSRMPALRAWCRETFPEAIVITGAEPEFSVSRGLAYSGRIDEEIRAFREEVRELVESSTVERIVEEHVEDLFHRTVDTLVEPILRNAAIPVFQRWREGGIRRLSDIDAEMEHEIETWLHSPEAAELLVKPITAWLRPVAYRLEEHTMPICVRHNVPYRALSLTSYLSLAEIDVQVNARDVFAVEELTWMVNTIISILVGLLCGGSGIALISSGISGIVAGAMLTLLLLFLGREKMESAFMNLDIPVVMRKIVPKGYFDSRMEKISGEVKKTCFEKLEKEQSEEVARRMISEISSQIEDCLMRMAEVVEIPLGK